ncbi:hypothetical protein M0R45_024770 [Rubus argutus]|uniref:Protein kinase domain-containing protein n=1 Tax=Rubus argutus TaxID=59490 RepID=A0AAW1WSH8_RUBAR
MERYEFVRKIGEGSFGCVYQAIDKSTLEFVAIKKLKHQCDSSSYVDLPEVRALCTLRHPNIVRLKEVQRQHHTVYFVFEYMQGSLRQLINTRRIPFSEAEIRSLSFQVLQGLASMHDGHGYMHRDMKPENLLVNPGVIKISDLGSATEINSGPPFQDYVTTRWYRAPEMLLQSFIYDEKVDMWAMGAIIAELFLMRPLFPGVNSADQLYRICSVIGAPTKATWKEAMLLASQLEFRFPPMNGVGLRAMMPYASDSAIDLIGSLCSWDPLKRPTAAQALQHPFFNRGHNVEAPFSSCTHTTNQVVPKITKLTMMQLMLGV